MGFAGCLATILALAGFLVLVAEAAACLGRANGLEVLKAGAAGLPITRLRNEEIRERLALKLSMLMTGIVRQFMGCVDGDGQRKKETWRMRFLLRTRRLGLFGSCGVFYLFGATTGQFLNGSTLGLFMRIGN